MRDWIEQLESNVRYSKAQKDAILRRIKKFQEDFNHSVKMNLITMKLDTKKIFIDFFKDIENMRQDEQKKS